MNPRLGVELIVADWARQREEAWRELHRRPDAPPLPPEPEPGPSLRSRLDAAIAAWLDPAKLERQPAPAPASRRPTDVARRR